MSSAATEERKRTLYISSENVDWFTSSERITINLNQSIVPDDGYLLGYSLKSIGFNSTAMNISEKQKNNKICYKLEYDDSDVTHTMSKEDGPNQPVAAFYQVANVPPITERLVTITVPDGSYTLSDLFFYLSTNINPTIHIPSGYYYDYDKDIEDIDNIVPMGITWTETPSGFVIELATDYLDTDRFTTSYEDPHDEETTLSIEYLFPKLTSLSIVPHETHPYLFGMLFTNYNTEYENTPISIPPGTLQKGLNPHYGVTFNFKIPDLSRPDLLEDISITEIGNETLYDIPNRIYPTSEKVNYHNYIAYYKPVLDPTYVDIMISLPNSAMDERGHRNILTRLFTLGSKQGGSSFFQMWEQPKVTILSGMSGFSSITLDIESQANKWNFFNLEFSIELEISEFKEEDPEAVHQAAELNLAPSDPVADVAQNAGPRHQKALSSHHFSYRTGALRTHKKTRYV
jgi:hypothetical protein